MKKYYLGISTGKNEIYGVMIDRKKNIIWKKYFHEENNIMYLVKKMFLCIDKELKVSNYKIINIGVVGRYSNILKVFLHTNTINTTTYALLIGILNQYPNTKLITIFDNNKIISFNIKRRKIINYNEFKYDYIAIKKELIPIILIGNNSKIIKLNRLHFFKAIGMSIIAYKSKSITTLNFNTLKKE